MWNSKYFVPEVASNHYFLTSFLFLKHLSDVVSFNRVERKTVSFSIITVIITIIFSIYFICIVLTIFVFSFFKNEKFQICHHHQKFILLLYCALNVVFKKEHREDVGQNLFSWVDKVQPISFFPIKMFYENSVQILSSFMLILYCFFAKLKCKVEFQFE